MAAFKTLWQALGVFGVFERHDPQIPTACTGSERVPFWDYFGTIWDHFGTILGPFWDILGPFWNHFGSISRGLGLVYKVWS